jgi:hypothetical protein
VVLQMVFRGHTVFVHGPTVSRDDRPVHHLSHHNMKLLSHVQ